MCRVVCWRGLVVRLVIFKSVPNLYDTRDDWQLFLLLFSDVDPMLGVL